MKNTLMVPVVFITNLVVWMCLLSFFSLLGTYEFLAALLRHDFSFFFTGMLYRSLYLLPLSVLLSFINIYLFIMRHKTFMFVSLPLALLLLIVSVLFVMPFSYRVMDRIAFFNPAKMTLAVHDGEQVFLPGYIRRDSESRQAIWLAASGDSTKAFPVIVANTASPDEEARVVTVYPEAIYSPEKTALLADSTIVVDQAGGKDPLILTSIELPFFLTSILRDVIVVTDHFRLVWLQNPVFFFWVAGCFGMSVFALWVFCFATGWRLLNVILMASCFRMLYFAYPQIYGERINSLVRGFLPASVSPVLASPLVFAAFAMVLLLVALGIFIKRKVSHNGPEAFYD